MSIVGQHQQHLLEQASSPLWGGYVNMLKTLESMFQSPKHWILEFLQNAEDASSSKFAIRLDDTSIEILNDGNVFKEPDFYTICDVNSRKLPSLGLRGYIGIGFKSIFRITDKIEIHSGEFNFAFDKACWEEHIQKNGLLFSKLPWEILPIEIGPKPLPDGFTTAFDVPLKTLAGQSALKEITNYLTNYGLLNVLDSMGFPKEIILLVRNVKTIQITTPDHSIVVTKESKLSEKVTVGQKEIANIKKQFAGETLSDETDYLVFRTTVTVDEDVRQDPDTERVRRSEITERDIGLVFPLDSDGNIVPSLGTLTGVYSFLPIEGEQTGLPFGIFGDFIPSPGRDQINYGAKWNQWMCRKILEFFKKVVECELLMHPSWKFFPSQAYDELKRASRGTLFWNENLRQPILDFLGSIPIFLDQEQNLHTLNDFFITSADIKEIFTDDELQKATGKKSLHPTMLKLKVIQPNVAVKEIDILYVLRNEVLLDSIKNDIEKLSHLYSQIEHLSDYYIKGRPWGRGTKDIPLRQIPFVLGDDNQFYPPAKVKLLQKVEEIPAFLSLATTDTKVPLHPEIAKDEKAVVQLKRCGMELVGLEETISTVKGIVNGIATKQINPPSPQLYDDFIGATLWLAAHRSSTAVKVVVEDGTLQLPSDVFVPGVHFDWQPLWEANLLPGYFPISSKYFELASKYGLKIEQLSQCLEEMGVHGFNKETDDRLVSIAGEAVARKRLTDEGHNPASVADHDKLGYDLMCQGHCDSVFEVKGMLDPRDVTLQASQVDRAKEYADKYVLVCVYNLPNNPSNVGYKEVPDPEQIWTPEEKARVPKKKWLKA
jgi:hypothetical protein